jgi:hypothetical protein
MRYRGRYWRGIRYRGENLLDECVKGRKYSFKGRNLVDMSADGLSVALYRLEWESVPTCTSSLFLLNNLLDSTLFNWGGLETKTSHPLTLLLLGQPGAHSYHLRKVWKRVWFESYVRSLSLHLYKRLFSGLKLMTSWSQGNSFTDMLVTWKSLRVTLAS